MSTSRLFVAVWPDDEVVAALTGLPRPEEPGVRWSTPANWHVTLRFIGDTPADIVDTVVERLAGAELPAARIGFGPQVATLGDTVVVVPVTGADELAAAVGAATSGIGQPDRYSFHGHLTIGRTGPDTTCSLVGAPIEAVQTVDQIALVVSHLDSDGPRYTTEAVVPVSRGG